MIKFFTIDEDTGDEVVNELPSRKEVCGRCYGEGKHVNPNIDSHGISREEFDEDPDFKEAYFSGVYDVTCHECNGLRVVDVVDEGACHTPERKALLARYYDRLDEDAAYRRECEAERRFGC